MLTQKDVLAAYLAGLLNIRLTSFLKWSERLTYIELQDMQYRIDQEGHGSPFHTKVLTAVVNGTAIEP